MSPGREERQGLELRFHFGERDRAGSGDRALDVVVLEACERAGARAAELLRGVEGFGAGAVMRTERVLSLSEDAPLVAVAVGEASTIEALAEEVRGIASAGLLTIGEVGIVAGGAMAIEGVDSVEEAGLATTGTPTTTAAGVGVPVVGSPADGGSDVVRATIWGPRSGARSPHLRAVDALRRHGADAATVLLGVDGVLEGERRRARFVAANRGLPAVTVAIGERGAIDAALAEVDDLADLVTIGGVERNRPYEAERLHGKRPSAAPTESTRTTLVTSEAAQHGGRPRYLALIHELRHAGAPGATALRGVWGFRGEGAPHGDRVLALRRDVPLIVEVVDSPERSSRWLELAEALGEEPDLTYCEAVGRRSVTD